MLKDTLDLPCAEGTTVPQTMGVRRHCRLACLRIELARHWEAVDPYAA